MSGSGKTTLTRKILSEEFFQEKPVKIILCVPKNMSGLLDTTLEDYRSKNYDLFILYGYKAAAAAVIA